MAEVDELLSKLESHLTANDNENEVKLSEVSEEGNSKRQLGEVKESDLCDVNKSITDSSLKCDNDSEEPYESDEFFSATDDDDSNDNDGDDEDDGDEDDNCDDEVRNKEDDDVEDVDEACKEEKIDEEEHQRVRRLKLEEALSDDEKLERKEKAQELKNVGNKLFRENKFMEAMDNYTEALKICPYSFPKERSIMFSNRAVCHMKFDNNDAAIKDCSDALELHPYYLKALLRRAELYEKTEKLDESLTDYQKALELDPTQNNVRVTVMKLSDQIQERNEKMKTEMLGKLKDLGNIVLKPFGLSTENFQLQQNPDTGSYSVNFKQN